MTDASVAPGPEPEARASALAAGFPEQGRDDWQRLVAAVLNKGRADDDRLDGPQAEAALRRHLEGGLEVDALYLRDDRDLGVPGAMPFTRGRALRDATPLGRPPAARRPGRRRHPGRGARRPRARSHVGVGARGRRRPRRRPTCPRSSPTCGSTSPRWSSRRSPTRRRGPGPARPRRRPGVGRRQPRPRPVRRRRSARHRPRPQPLADLVRECRPARRMARHHRRRPVLHEAGATDVDALAVAVATAVEYLRHLEAAGIPADEAFGQIDLRLGATADQFLTAAALRAARRVWARVGEACGVVEDRRGVRTHAVTSLRMFTREDPWVNVLRSTLAAFGASVGGADAITVLPYDTVLGLPERFSRRLARNTQILLADESNVGRVTDPGGGSWYLESLTDQVAAAVWARFQEVERGRWGRARPRRRAAPRLGRRARRRARPRDRHPPAPAHRRLDVPVPPGDARRPPGRARPRRYRPGPGTPPRLDRLRGAARPGHGGRRAGSVLVRTFGTRRDSRCSAGVRGPTCSPPAGIAAADAGSRSPLIASSPSLCRRRGGGGRRPAGRRPSACSSRDAPTSSVTPPPSSTARSTTGWTSSPSSPTCSTLGAARPAPPRDGGFAMSAVPDFTGLDLGDGRAGAPVLAAAR